jgi:hypothetical protein
MSYRPDLLAGGNAWLKCLTPTASFVQLSPLLSSVLQKLALVWMILFSCLLRRRIIRTMSIQLSVETPHYQNHVFHLNLLPSRIVADKKSARPPLTEPLETLIHVDRHRVGRGRNRYMDGGG